MNYLNLFLILLFFNNSYSKNCYHRQDCPIMNDCLKNECSTNLYKFNDLSNYVPYLLIISTCVITTSLGLNGRLIIYITLLHFYDITIKDANLITRSLCFICSLFCFILTTVKNKHSIKKIRLDYDISLIVMPSLLTGKRVCSSIIGSMNYKMVIFFNLIFFIYILTIVIRSKVLKDKESIKMEINEIHNFKILRQESIRTESQENEVEIFPVLNSLQQNNINKELQKDKKLIKCENAIFIVFSLVFSITDLYIRGNNLYPSGINIVFSSSLYWFTFLFFVDASFLIIFVSWRHIVQKNYNYRVSINYPFEDSDFKWNNINFIRLFLFAFYSGVLSEYSGFEEGLIIGLILNFVFDINPVNTISTTNFIVFITSLHDTIISLFEGLFFYNIHSVIYMFLSIIIGTLLGVLLLQRLIDSCKSVKKLYSFIYIFILLIVLVCLIINELNFIP